jgi:glutamate-1-semialdehyde 2,1-aminomutase
MELTTSQRLFDRSKSHIPGGVNSPVRSYSNVGGTPPFIASGQGSKITDADCNSYIDYVMSWGPLILGHAHPDVVEAVRTQAGLGVSYGAPTELELELAEMITGAFESMDMVRLVNSGTEACMTALRLARAFTGRDKILKFEGCYHGHSDGLLVSAGSGAAYLSEATSAGVTESQASDTFVAGFNDLQQVESIFESAGEQVAAVIVEPVAGNMGMVMPEPGFLEGLRKITSEHGSLLIFDEVITGFRVMYGGYQDYAGITPDITCLGKVIGGGLPVGAYGGRQEVMETVAPLGPMYQAGTLSGNPIAVAAGVATLRTLQTPAVYETFSVLTDRLCSGLEAICGEAGLLLQVSRLVSMWGLHFSESPVTSYADAAASDADAYGRFFHSMLESGIYLAPSAYETSFVSTAHTEADIDETLDAARRALVGG